MTSASDVVAIDLPARLWSVVDGQIDNTVSLATVDGPEAVAELRRSIPRYEDLAAEFSPDRAGPYVEAVELGRQAIEVIDFNLG